MSGKRAGTKRTEQTARPSGRRSFLKLAGAGAATGAAAAVAGPGQASAETPPTGTAAGYRETEHVKKAYDLARF